jgi:hypothetical protein
MESVPELLHIQSCRGDLTVYNVMFSTYKKPLNYAPPAATALVTTPLTPPLRSTDSNSRIYLAEEAAQPDIRHRPQRHRGLG